MGTALYPGRTPGRFLATLDPAQAQSIRQELHRRVGSPSGGFGLDARAWYVVGLA